MSNKRWLSSDSMSAVLTAFIFALAGAIPIFSTMGFSAGLDIRTVCSLVMSGGIVGCILSVYLSKRCKAPVYVACSITAVAVIEPLLKEFSCGEIVFGYIAAGVVLMLLGAFRLIGKIAKFIPLSIVLAMVAGVYMSYGLNLIEGVKAIPIAGGLIVVSFFAVNLIFKRFPPQAAALISAVLVTCFMVRRGHSEAAGTFELKWIPPRFILPEINLDILVYITLPLVILALSDLFKGYGILKANGYDLSLDQMAVYCGGGSIICAFGLGHTISLTGPVIAILSGKDAGKKQYRYIGVMAANVIIAGAFLMSGTVIGLLSLLSKAIINIVCGLAMIGLLTSSLGVAFGSAKFTLGSLTAFVVGLSHFSALGIGAPVWAILFGVIVSLLAERKDFQAETSSDNI